VIRLLVLLIVVFFLGLSFYRYLIFKSPLQPTTYNLQPIYAGIGYTPLDPTKYEVTDLIHDGLSQPISVTLSSDNQTLYIYQQTGELLGLTRDSQGEFSLGPILLHTSSPPPSVLDLDLDLDLYSLVRRNPESQPQHQYQPTKAVSDPVTGYIYFADTTEGRLYRIKPIQ
jgi:DNA-binding beta-propeller fold protein YncE